MDTERKYGEKNRFLRSLWSLRNDKQNGRAPRDTPPFVFDKEWGNKDRVGPSQFATCLHEGLSEEIQH